MDARHDYDSGIFLGVKTRVVVCTKGVDKDSSWYGTNRVMKYNICTKEKWQ
jgi:hypothetical protein